MPRQRPNIAVAPYCPYCLQPVAFPAQPVTGDSVERALAEYQLICETCGWRGYSPRFMPVPDLECKV
jgi:hypothetical protein